MKPVIKTKETISEAVKEFLNENSLSLKDISINLLKEKVFINKKLYTIELSKKQHNSHKCSLTENDKATIKNLMDKILLQMYFNNFTTEISEYQNYLLLKIKTNGKDGLLIGKNGQNLFSLQYIFSIIVSKKLRKNISIIIDVDSYYEKRVNYLKKYLSEVTEKLSNQKGEVITDLLPPNERKIIHEEISKYENLKTFSVGKGIYKKVVITALL